MTRLASVCKTTVNSNHSFVTCFVTLTQNNVKANWTYGGNGVGGGAHDDGSEVVETFFADASPNIHGNEASTSHKDVFGKMTLLDDLLSLI